MALQNLNMKETDIEEQEILIYIYEYTRSLLEIMTSHSFYSGLIVN